MLSLLPPLEPAEFEQEAAVYEGTPLLRELKTEITDACLRRVLPFPALPSHSRLRNRIVFLVLALLIWYFIRTLVE